MFYKNMRKKIRTRRQICGYTQEKVAELAGISISFYGHIERGTRKMNIDTLYRIAIALDSSADEIMGLHRNKNQSISALELLGMAEKLAEELNCVMPKD